MAEPQAPTQDSAGVTRAGTGEITNPQPTSTPGSQTSLQPGQTASTTPSSPTTETTSLLNEPAAPEAKSPAQDGDGKPEDRVEAYADFKAPEGFELDRELIDEVTPIFRKNGLSQEGAQELVDFYAKNVKEALDAPYEVYKETRKGWRDEIQADPEIGGKLDAVKTSIGRLIDSFGNPKVAEGFRRAMDLTGAGDNPDIVRGLYALSQRLAEGTSVRGNGPSPEGQRAPGTPARPSAAQAMDPHLPSQTG